MIYLSRLLLNPRSRQAQAEQRNPYELHRTLSRAFGDGKEAIQAARCLFRMEETADSDSLFILVQSRVAPEWDRLSPSPGYWSGPPEVKPVELHLSRGRNLAFRLRANPTICQDGKRRPVKDESGQLRWLERKGDSQGFRLNLIRVTHSDVVGFRTAEGMDVTLNAVLFDGVLTVVDSGRFAAAIENGIGPAKGFGMGLLSVAPVG